MKGKEEILAIKVNKLPFFFLLSLAPQKLDIIQLGEELTLPGCSVTRPGSLRGKMTTVSGVTVYVLDQRLDNAWISRSVSGQKTT